MRFSIFVRNDDESKALQDQLKERMLQAHHVEDHKHPELVFFIGGDGTFLRAVHHYLPAIENITFLGIQTGTLGFFCAYEKDELDQVIQSLDHIHAHEYPLLQAEITDLDGQKHVIHAINEIRLENPYHTMISKVFIDNEFLEDYRGNGLLVSSTLGSSAYNKSCGGALIDTHLSLLELTEIAPLQNIAYRSIGSSLVLDANRKIVFQGNFKTEIIGYDHLLFDSSTPMTKVEITSSPLKIHLVRSSKHNFPETIRNAFIEVTKEKK